MPRVKYKFSPERTSRRKRNVKRVRAHRVKTKRKTILPKGLRY